jgi:predicted ATPase
MKILLGSHGTGKTTLLKEVSTKFPDYYVTDGFSRPVIKISKMLELSNSEKQYAINELSAWAYQNYLSHKNVISTRSIVDCIIYSEILTPKLGIKELINLFEETKNQVEYFFYIPVEFDYVADPDRLSHELQVKIDEIIKDFIEKYIPKEKVVILTGTVEERLDQISKYL